jgi:hypothetical protein
MYIITLGDARPTDLQKQTSLSYVQSSAKNKNIYDYFFIQKRKMRRHKAFSAGLVITKIINSLKYQVFLHAIFVFKNKNIVF